MELQPYKIKNIFESLLFVARKPLTLKDIQQALALDGKEQASLVSEEVILAALNELTKEYESRGINIHQVAGGYLMTSKSENAEYVHSLLHAKVQTTLTVQALETLAIIAYKQPVTKVEVDRIRGVNSDGPVETLLAKKLVQEMGRSDAVGRPYLYGTTTGFLRHFGLKDISSLPPLPISSEEQGDVFKSVLHEEEEQSQVSDQLELTATTE